MKSMIRLAIAALLFCTACNNAAKPAGGPVNKQEKEQTTGPADNNRSNGIRIQENGLKVEKAMLLNANKAPLSPENTVGIGEPVYCRLFISGWKEEQGRVRLGASETISSVAGEIVTREDDVFHDLKDAAAADAHVVTLKATITTLKKSVRDFEVNFKVWDKVSNASASGSYTFHLSL